MQLFTLEKRDTLAFHIMTKEIYPHSALITQFNPARPVNAEPLPLLSANAGCVGSVLHAAVIRTC